MYFYFIFLIDAIVCLILRDPISTHIILKIRILTFKSENVLHFETDF